MWKFWHNHSPILSTYFSNQVSLFDFFSNFCLLFCFLGDFVSLLPPSLSLSLSLSFRITWSLHFSTLATFYFITTFTCGETIPNLCQNFILKDCSPVSRMWEPMVFIERFQKKIFFYFGLKMAERLKLKYFLLTFWPRG